MKRFSLIYSLILLFAGLGSLRAEEPQSARTAWQGYISGLETRLNTQNASGGGFLWIDQDPSRRDAVRRGETPIQHVSTPQVLGGTLEDWIGAVYIPGATLNQVLNIDQDYPNYSRYYAPEIVTSRVISHNGNHFQVFYRMKKHKFVTAVLDTTHDVDFLPLAADRYAVRSRSVRVQEVKNAGERDEEILPEGEGMGFLWAMNSYWRVEQRDDGVYVECEVVTLARSIPFGMGALIRGMIESFASESLTNTLVAKKKAVLAVR